MQVSNHNNGYILLEVLMAVVISSTLITLSLHYQVKLIKKSAERFQQLSVLNHSRNSAVESVMNVAKQ